MEFVQPADTEEAHARDLELVLRTTLSILNYRALHISQDRSLLNLDSALRSAIAHLGRRTTVPAIEQE